MWVSITSSSTHIARNLRTKLRLSGCRTLVAGQLETLAEIRNDHYNGPWWQKIRSDYNVVSCHEVASPTTVLPARCGVECISDQRILMAHQRACKKCRELSPKPKPGPVKTLFKVQGLHDFSINGLLSVMKGQQDALVELAAEYEQTIKALEGLETLEEKRKRFEAEAEEHRKALAFFLKEEGGRQIAESNH